MDNSYGRAAFGLTSTHHLYDNSPLHFHQNSGTAGPHDEAYFRLSITTRCEADKRLGAKQADGYGKPTWLGTLHPLQRILSKKRMFT